jgi:stearoyl-CoA desaturase (delta-9 desaturase)
VERARAKQTRVSAALSRARHPARVVADAGLARRQHIAAAATAGLGLAGVVGAAATAVFLRRVSALEIITFVAFFLPIQLGVTAGFHRHFAHGSFAARPLIRTTLAVLGCMAGQGTPVFWVALHRMHHELSDREGDPHSPNVKRYPSAGRASGLFYAYFGWIFRHPVPNPTYYARDLLRDPMIMRANRGYLLWMALGLLLPGALGALAAREWTGVVACVLWGGPVRMFVGHNMIWWITSFAHSFGRRDFVTNDRSTNNFWLAIPTLGESWHNNHHSFPRAATLDFLPWQLDITGSTIRLLGKLGLVYNIRAPSAATLGRRRLRAESA